MQGCRTVDALNLEDTRIGTSVSSAFKSLLGVNLTKLAIKAFIALLALWRHVVLFFFVS